MCSLAAAASRPLGETEFFSPFVSLSRNSRVSRFIIPSHPCSPVVEFLLRYCDPQLNSQTMKPRRKSTRTPRSKTQNTGVTTREFRSMALSLPSTSEQAHMNHPDFRVEGKIFATLGYPDTAWGMVKLTPEQQKEFVHGEPHVFDPCNGAWGRRGATSVRLDLVAKDVLWRALATAWRNTAPKHLFEGPDT